MTVSDDQLESLTRKALHARADAFYPAPPERPAVPRRTRRAPLVATAVAVCMVFAGTGVWAALRSTTESGVVADGGPPPSAGVEVALRAVGTPPEVDAYLNGMIPGPRGSTTKTLRVGDRPPIAVRPVPSTDAFRRCAVAGTPTADQPNVGISVCDATTDDRSHGSLQYLPAGDTLYAVWLHVPQGTAYVVLSGDARAAWARPRYGVVAFPVANESTGATVRAFSTEGRLLGEAGVPTRPRGAEGRQPPWYNLEATIDFCDTAPLSELVGIMPAVSTTATFSAFDHATGTEVTVDSRQACKQAAPLLPPPGGGLRAHFTLRDGRIHADYHEEILTSSGGGTTGTEGPPVSAEEARRRIDAERARLRTFCSREMNQTRNECR